MSRPKTKKIRVKFHFLDRESEIHASVVFNVPARITNTKIKDLQKSLMNDFIAEALADRLNTTWEWWS